MRLVKNLLILYIITLPFIGKIIEGYELIFFFLPPILLFIFLALKHPPLIRITKNSFFIQITLIFLYFISTLLSQNFGISINRFFEFLNLILIFNLCNLVFAPKDLLKAIAISSLIYSTVFLLAQFSGLPLLSHKSGDEFLTKFWGHSELAHFIVLSISFLLTNLVSRKNLKFIVFYVLINLTLVLTFSRSALIALIISLPFFKTATKTQAIIKKVTILLYLIFTISYLYLSAKQLLPQKNLFGERPTFAIEALKGFIDQPIFGNGPGTFLYISGKHQSQDLINNFCPNFLLAFLSENGIIFTSYLFGLIFLALKNTKNNLFFTTSIIVIIGALTDSNFNSFGISLISLILLFNSEFKPKYNKSNPPTLIYFCFLILLTGTYLIQNYFSFYYYQKGNYVKSISLYPFDLQPRLALILNHSTVDQNIWQKNLGTTLKYYPNEILVYEQLVNTLPLPASEPFYYQLFLLAPNSNQTKYIDLARYYKNKDDLQKFNYLLNLICDNVSQFDLSSDDQKYLINSLYWQSLQNYEGSPNIAIKYIKTGIKINPNILQLHFELANMYWHRNQKNEAIQELYYSCPKVESLKKYCLEYLNDHLKYFPKLGSDEISYYFK